MDDPPKAHSLRDIGMKDQWKPLTQWILTYFVLKVYLLIKSSHAPLHLVKTNIPTMCTVDCKTGWASRCKKFHTLTWTKRGLGV